MNRCINYFVAGEKYKSGAGKIFRCTKVTERYGEFFVTFETVDKIKFKGGMHKIAMGIYLPGLQKFERLY